MAVSIDGGSAASVVLATAFGVGVQFTLQVLPALAAFSILAQQAAPFEHARVGLVLI
jgi:hypothetical protein